jgi:hypothetical protein
MHHKSIGASHPQLEEVSAALLVHLQVDTAVADIFENGQGANAAGHYVALGSNGRRYGLKASTRGGVTDGTEKEVLLSHLAALLNLPNAERYHQCPKGMFSFRSDLSFALMPWIHNAKQLQGLDAGEQSAIQADGRVFGSQMGQWMAFGYLFSVRDRHGGNWVWAPAAEQLAMIDTEDCLGGARAFPNEYTALADVLRACANRADSVSSAVDGFCAVFDRYHNRAAAVRHLLAHSQFASSFTSPHDSDDPRALSTQWISDLGL